jgi:hypothetical protein
VEEGLKNKGWKNLGANIGSFLGLLFGPELLINARTLAPRFAPIGMLDLSWNIGLDSYSVKWALSIIQIAKNSS